MNKPIVFLFLAALVSPGTALSACQKDRSESTPTSRFILQDGQAFDRKTNLTWDRCSLGTAWNGTKCVGAAKLVSLDSAKKLASQRGEGWRVPTIEELYSIVEPRCSQPAINAEVFPGVKNLGEGAPYWSSSRIREMPSLVYFVDFLSGEVDGHGKEFALAVRLVRSGQ